MKGIDYLSVISGVILVFGGAGLILVGILFPPIIVYGVIALILGIVILVTLKKQEEIEPIKARKGIKTRRVKR